MSNTKRDVNELYKLFHGHCFFMRTRQTAFSNRIVKRKSTDLSLSEGGFIMNQKVGIAEVIALSKKVTTAKDKVVTDLDAVSKSIDDIVAMEDFTGEAAASVKNYFTDVHQTISSAFQQLFIEIHENLEKHIENFQSSVDESDVARIERAYIEDEKEDIQTNYTNLQEQAWEVAEIIEGVSDITNITIPRLSYAETAKDEAIETMEGIETNLDTFTSQGKNEQVEEMLHHINVQMKALKTQSGESRFNYVESASPSLSSLSSLEEWVERKKVQRPNEALRVGDLVNLSALPRTAKVKKSESKISKGLKTVGSKVLTGIKTTGKTIKGGSLGLYDAGKDAIVGAYHTVTDPIGAANSVVHMVSHPIETAKYVGHAIDESFQRDMVHGDAESRAHWVTYALGTVASSVVGSKGAGSVAKTGAKSTQTTVTNVSKSVKNLDLSDLLPYAPQYQLALVGPVPYNVIDGVHLRDQVIMFSKHFLDQKKTKLQPNTSYRAGEFDYLYKTDQFGRIKEFTAEDLKLTDRENRLPHNPNTHGKKPGDHAGHLAGDRFGGSPELDNLVSQLDKVNLSYYKKIENEWAVAIKDGKHVSVNVKVNYDRAHLRPVSFDIEYAIDGRERFINIKN